LIILNTGGGEGQGYVKTITTPPSDEMLKVLEEKNRKTSTSPDCGEKGLISQSRTPGKRPGRGSLTERAKGGEGGDAE